MPDDDVSRTDRLATNAVFSVVAWFLPLLIGFFTTPILVRGLGNENYGLYAVITGFMAYSFSFGIGKVAAKYVAEYRASGETERLNPVISATFAFSFSIAAIGTIILALFARTIVTDVLLIEGSAVDVAVTSLYLACAISFAAMISQIYQNVLQGLHRFGSFLVVTNLNGILLGAGNIAIVLSGGGIIALLGWNTVVAVIIGIAFYFVARQGLPGMSLTFDVDRKTIRTVLGYGTSIIFYQIFSNVLFIFERALVMRKFGARELAFYSVPMLLAIYLHSFVGSFAVVLFPMVNELLSDRERQIDLYQKATKLILALVSFVLVTFVCTGSYGLAVWINMEFSEHSYRLLVIHSLTFGAIAVSSIAWQLAEGFGRARINTFVTAVYMVFTIPLMVLAADIYGPEGVAFSRLVIVLLMLPVILYCEVKFLGRVFVSFWVRSLSTMAITVVAAGVVETWVINFFAGGWSGLAAAGVSGGCTFIVLLLLTGYFTPSERRLFLSMATEKLGLRSRILP